jgi:hypothetical protein
MMSFNYSMPSPYFELDLPGPLASVLMLYFFAALWFYRRVCKIVSVSSAFGVVKKSRQQCILAHVHFDTSWAPAFLSGTGHVILPTYLPKQTRQSSCSGPRALTCQTLAHSREVQVAYKSRQPNLLRSCSESLVFPFFFIQLFP